MIHEDPRAYLLGLESMALLRAFTGEFGRGLPSMLRAGPAAIPPVRCTDGRPGRLSSYRHPIGDYLRAALAAGLQLRRCEEPLVPAGERPARADPSDTFGPVGPWELWPWSLAALVPEAAYAVSAGAPALVVWHFQAGELTPP